MKVPFVLCLLLAASACSTLGDRQHAEQLSSSRLDNDYCVDHGLHYPDPAYTQCRRQLVDQRLYRDWQNLQLMHQTGRPANPAAADQGFRRPDPNGFHCHAEPQFGNDYVFCAYDDSSADSR